MFRSVARSAAAAGRLLPHATQTVGTSLVGRNSAVHHSIRHPRFATLVATLARKKSTAAVSTKLFTSTPSPDSDSPCQMISSHSSRPISSRRQRRHSSSDSSTSLSLSGNIDLDTDVADSMEGRKKGKSVSQSLRLESKVVFDACWRRLIKKYGQNDIKSPGEIVWLNGAPGSGKGANTKYIQTARGLRRAIVVSSLLAEHEQCKKLIDQGQLIDDATVGDVLLESIFDPSRNDRIGMVIDGFPRTGEQVDFLKLLHDRLQELHLMEQTSKAHATGNHEQRWPRPRFRIVVLYVDETVSVKRQLDRLTQAAEHNRKVDEALHGQKQEVRATDASEHKALGRYQTFRSHYPTLVRLKAFFPFTLIDAMGSLSDCKEQIVNELRYQSSLELNDETYDMIQELPLSVEIVSRSRQQLVARLDGYFTQHHNLFLKVMEIIKDDVIPYISKSSMAGHSQYNTQDEIFDNPIAIQILIDVLTDRGFFASYRQHKQPIATKVDLKTGEITFNTFVNHTFRVEFEVPDMRRRAKRSETF